MEVFGELLKFKPQFKERVWGSDKLATLLNKSSDPQRKIGESWEICGLNESASIVLNGMHQGKSLNELIEIYGDRLLGKKVMAKFGKQFPILIKFLDASDKLSIQVHPDDEQAQKMGFSYGKSEMWYICKADRHATISSGFKENTTKKQFQEMAKNNTLLERMNTESTQEEEFIYTPAQTVHAIGKGNLILEIQQSSDITYRVNDYGRKGIDGKPRDLHLKEALEVANLKSSKGIGKINYLNEMNKVNTMLSNDIFQVDMVNARGITVRDYKNKESFVCMICLEGDLELMSDHSINSVSSGEVILISSDVEEVQIYSIKPFKLMEVSMKV